MRLPLSSRKKIAEFGAQMMFHEVFDDDDQKITDGCLRAIEAGAEIVFCTGGMSVDPDDKTPLAIKNTGARIVSYGSPVLPGAMFCCRTMMQVTGWCRYVDCLAAPCITSARYLILYCRGLWRVI